MTVQARAYMNALWLFFALCLALAGVVVAMSLLADEVQKAKLVPAKLPAWSDQRILGELGEAAQVMPCDEIVGAPGMTARFFVQEDARRLIVVCTAAK